MLNLANARARGHRAGLEDKKENLDFGHSLRHPVPYEVMAREAEKAAYNMGYYDGWYANEN